MCHMPTLQMSALTTHQQLHVHSIRRIAAHPCHGLQHPVTTANQLGGAPIATAAGVTICISQQQQQQQARVRRRLVAVSFKRDDVTRDDVRDDDEESEVAKGMSHLEDITRRELNEVRKKLPPAGVLCCALVCLWQNDCRMPKCHCKQCHIQLTQQQPTALVTVLAFTVYTMNSNRLSVLHDRAENVTGKILRYQYYQAETSPPQASVNLMLTMAATYRCADHGSAVGYSLMTALLLAAATGAAVAPHQVSSATGNCSFALGCGAIVHYQTETMLLFRIFCWPPAHIAPCALACRAGLLCCTMLSLQPCHATAVTKFLTPAPLCLSCCQHEPGSFLAVSS